MCQRRRGLYAAEQTQREREQAVDMHRWGNQLRPHVRGVRTALVHPPLQLSAPSQLLSSHMPAYCDSYTDLLVSPAQVAGCLVASEQEMHA